jgi:hypothetical protein
VDVLARIPIARQARLRSDAASRAMKKALPGNPSKRLAKLSAGGLKSAPGAEAIQLKGVCVIKRKKLNTTRKALNDSAPKAVERTTLSQKSSLRELIQVYNVLIGIFCF